MSPLRPLKYAVQCMQMRQLDQFVVDDYAELLRVLERYVTRYGPIDLLYRVD